MHNAWHGNAAINSLTSKLKSADTSAYEVTYVTTGSSPATIEYAASPPHGFAFDAEVVLLTHRLNLAFRRVPVTLVNEFSSTLSLRRNALPMLLDVMRLWVRNHTGRAAPDPQFIFAESEHERRAA